MRRVKPDVRQMLLDELAGQLESPNKVIRNPTGWMLTLIERWKQGNAVLALAETVQAERQERAAP